MDTIQINKFSRLHDGKNIIFCKTECLEGEFENIKNLKNDVVLISGNSDICVDDDIFNKRPPNISKWFAQNALVNHEILEPLPIGIENRYPSIRDGHGIGWGDRVETKENVISNPPDIKFSKFIYSNFNIETNPGHRSQIREICINTNFIDWEEPNLSIETFFTKLLDYEAIVCAQGNGPGDNHRIYETLYMGRIPITFNKVMYEKLHYLFPVVLIEEINDLNNYEIMRKKIDEVKNKEWDKNTLSTDYWFDKIIKCK